MFAGDSVAHETLVLLFLGDVFDAEHQNLVVAEEFVQHELVEAGAKAGVSIRIERDEHDGDIKLLTRLRREAKKSVLERVLDYIILLDYLFFCCCKK